VKKNSDRPLTVKINRDHLLLIKTNSDRPLPIKKNSDRLLLIGKTAIADK
jgi:hypothetical protein